MAELVTVVTPTRNRERHLPLAYRCFASQTYENRRWLVLDASPAASEHMSALSDPRVTYVHSPSREPIGSLRNRLLDGCRDGVVCHFDDDDYYAPTYVSTMLRLMGHRALITLSAWYLLDLASGQAFYWDTTIIRPPHFILSTRAAPRPVSMSGSEYGEGWLHSQEWGYGFSHLYRPRLLAGTRFDDRAAAGEDYDFAVACHRRGLSCLSVPDHIGVVVHVVHKSNTSSAFPNYRLPRHILDAVFGGDFRSYMELCSGQGVA